MPASGALFEAPTTTEVVGAAVFSAALTSLAWSPAVHAAVARKWPRLPSRRAFRRWFLWGSVVHLGESAYTYRLAARTGRREVALRWAMTNLLVGFPVLVRLRRAPALI